MTENPENSPIDSLSASKLREIGRTTENFEEFCKSIEQYKYDLKRAEEENYKFERPSNMLKEIVFPHLMPAIETTLEYAARKHLLVHNRNSIFNGIDNVVEILWNENRKRQNEDHVWQNLFEMDWVQEYLKDHPRPVYPLSMFLSKEEAALIIQSFYRGHLVRMQPKIQKFRQYWLNRKNRIRKGYSLESRADSEASLLKRCHPVNMYVKRESSSNKEVKRKVSCRLNK